MVFTSWGLVSSLCIFALPSTSGFLSDKMIGRRSVKGKIHPTHLSSLSYDNTSVALDGVTDFEEWFSSNVSSGARANSICHALFNSMGRGLQFTSTKSSDLKGVAVVPRKLVMRVPISEEGDKTSERSWDTNLSCLLFDECQKGKDSAYYGYCSLLTRGFNLQPKMTTYPSTAPDTLRHWSEQQKNRLKESEDGKKLLDAENEQATKWRQKYDSLSVNEKEKLSYDNFLWAMEAVHSRAFKGNFNVLDGGEGGPLRKIASLLLPLSALAFGIVYASDPSMNQYFAPLSIVAASPVALTIIADQKGSKEAVMLPLIDSANHLEEADSVIEYDPTVDAYVLSLGEKCLVKEVDGAVVRAQVCISYGNKKDFELLINYGFLRGVALEGLKNEDNREGVRQRLIDEFLSRNPCVS